jgi:hypothetical protein
MMEKFVFKHLSQMEVCRRMAVICQESADQILPGAERDQFQAACDKFKAEAETLAIKDWQRTPLAP